MRKPSKEQPSKPVKVQAYDDSGHTLLPMLIAGLVLIIIGALFVMAFV
ncbi:hypothetical protein [Chelativorans sp. AA-79]|nr:hypothetical protein [Chelativorans sp. AA-79]WEX12047.1 hypothetical protein PVE73_21425 [Chelativorans sp. AA-79]